MSAVFNYYINFLISCPVAKITYFYFNKGPLALLAFSHVSFMKITKLYKITLNNPQPQLNNDQSIKPWNDFKQEVHADFAKYSKIILRFGDNGMLTLLFLLLLTPKLQWNS